MFARCVVLKTMGWRATVLFITSFVLPMVHGAFVVPKTMTAVVATGSVAKEGDFSKVKVMERPVPQPGKRQVLIQVQASSINPVDFKLLTFPQLDKLAPKVLGFDVAGTVVAVGSECHRLKIGDAVYADLGKQSLFNGVQLGAWAEYAVADEEQVALSKIATTLGMPDAGCMPLVGLTDFQAFKKAGIPNHIAKDWSVVITSGAGGTGMIALQMAKSWGAKRIVTAASPHHFQLLKSLGATEVYDYHTTTIWKQLENDSIDFVYDNYGAPGTADLAMPSIRKGGVFEFLPGKGGGLAKHPKKGVKQINFGLTNSAHHDDLDDLDVMAYNGNWNIVINKAYHLHEIKQALEEVFAGHVVGKVAVFTSSKHQNITNMSRQWRPTSLF